MASSSSSNFNIRSSLISASAPFGGAGKSNLSNVEKVSCEEPVEGTIICNMFM
jgi:hypothetical protein